MCRSAWRPRVPQGLSCGAIKWGFTRLPTPPSARTRRVCSRSRSPLHARGFARDWRPKATTTPSMFWVVYAVMKRKLLLGSMIAVVQGLFSTVARPLILRHIINEIQKEGLTIDQITFSLVALGLVVFMEGWFAVLYRHLMVEDMGTSFITATFAMRG